ncbi:MAG: MAE_28990/MAE_18760 family HEPN-like nuclease [Methylocella sp.]
MLSSQLLSTIEDELRWREAELALAKIQLQRSLGDAPLFRFSYRCFVAMTYAHFEAYTKRIVAQSMQDIFDAGHPWSKCLASIRTNLFASGLRQSMSKLSNADLAERGSLGGCLIDDVPAPSLTIILECGNMNVANFFWAIESIGLEGAKFAFARSDIGKLTSLRHDCAHGEALMFDSTKTEAQLASDMYSLQSRILTLMRTLAVEVVDFFTATAFLVK